MTVTPPRSWILNRRPGMDLLSATARSLAANTPPGVAGIVTGAVYPPRVAQDCFFFFFAFLRSTFW